MIEAEYRKAIRNGMAVLAAVSAIAILVGIQYGVIEDKGRIYLMLGVGAAVLLPIAGFALITAYYVAYAHLRSTSRAEEEPSAPIEEPEPMPSRSPPVGAVGARPSKPPLFPARRAPPASFPRRGT